MKFMSLKRLAVAAALVYASGAMADSISPESFETTLDVGESVTITKTVTVDDAATTSRADVFFLVDTSGSMGGTIDSVKANAAAILAGTSGFGDVAWGVGSYEDVPTSPWGGATDLPWRLNQAITTDTTAATAGIDDLTLRFGNDTPEANLIALSSAADEAGWRAGSQKFIIWFGDARGHDPSTTAGYPGPTLAETIAALTGENITVIAVNSGSLDSTGQATAITSATGGQLLSAAANPGSAIIDIILDSLEAAFQSYNTVSLGVNAVPGVDVSWTALFDTEGGPYTREVARAFDFSVTFTGVSGGVHSFTIDALVDGGVVATESDRITVSGDVPPPSGVPEPGVLVLLGSMLGALGFVARRRRSGTSA